MTKCSAIVLIADSNYLSTYLRWQAPVTPTVQQPVMNEDEKKGSGSALKIILTILIVLILGGLAVFGYIYWNNQKEAAQQELQAQRKAQADSRCKFVRR